MSLAFDIRTARVGDIPAIVELFGPIDELHSAAAPYTFRGSSAVPRSAQRIEELIAGPGTTILVAAAGERVLGQVGVEIVTIAADRMPFVPRRYGLVNDLMVTADAQRRGIGSALMAAAERWSIGEGVDAVELTVWEFNQNALRLYERLGYATQTRRLRRVLT
jgi:ribosomal protein S18 acetylase RimI-like enzyme